MFAWKISQIVSFHLPCVETLLLWIFQFALSWLQSSSKPFSCWFSCGLSMVATVYISKTNHKPWLGYVPLNNQTHTHTQFQQKIGQSSIIHLSGIFPEINNPFLGTPISGKLETGVTTQALCASILAMPSGASSSSPAVVGKPRRSEIFSRAGGVLPTC